METISQPCRDCVFAQYEGRTQKSCRAGMLDRFRSAGASIIDACDDGSDFFVIEGRTCPTYKLKNSKWHRKRLDRRCSMDDLLGDARREGRLRLRVFVDGFGAAVEDVTATVQSIVTQEEPPVVMTTVLTDRVGVDLAKLIAALRDFDHAPWEIRSIVEREPDGSPPPLGRRLDLGLTNNLKTNFYAVFRAGILAPDTFVQELDKALTDRLERFVLLLPQAEGDGLVVNEWLHRAVGGAREVEVVGNGERLGDVVEKLKHIAEREGLQAMVKGVGEVCPSMHLA